MLTQWLVKVYSISYFLRVTTELMSSSVVSSDPDVHSLIEKALKWVVNDSSSFTVDESGNLSSVNIQLVVPHSTAYTKFTLTSAEFVITSPKTDNLKFSQVRFTQQGWPCNED